MGATLFHGGFYMNSSFFYSTFVVIFLSVVFIIFCFSSVVTTLSYSNNQILISNDTISISDDIYLNFSNSKFLWPTPRI